ncbi:MAG: peptide-methionine (S)-S-oxide reductase [Candidatus Melainabacteria bacterium RIFCSPHIGHO2_02_FULL_34_12]|nr:MAG: peptide-methionine (S)-S-oxide reductase [Candidatus Melainabacteria bacterium RIFCSPHIGHO2_02_FULL_34_12]
MEKAIFACGCFWGVESALQKLDGVISTAVGYTGGRTKNPTYKEVCTGNTNHAEVVLIEFDPGKISYEKLVSFFFQIHDPTTLNRQGPDVGSQYRSAVFYFNENQKKIAEEIKKKINKNNVVTEILPASEFYKAEEYHQKYFEKMGIDGGCGIN